MRSTLISSEFGLLQCRASAASHPLHAWLADHPLHAWLASHPLHTQSSQHPYACRCHSSSLHTRLHALLLTHTLFLARTLFTLRRRTLAATLARALNAVLVVVLAVLVVVVRRFRLQPSPVRSARSKESRGASCRHTDSSEHCSLIAVDAMQLRGVLDGAVG